MSKRLVFLRDVWAALGRPNQFQARLGYGKFSGLTFTADVCDESPRVFTVHHPGIDPFEFDLETPDNIPKWVPPYEAWKQQETTKYQSVDEMLKTLTVPAKEDA